MVVTYFGVLKWVRFSNVGPKHTQRPRELQCSTPTIVFLADNIAAGSLCVRRRRTISSVFTNKFLLSTAAYIPRGFFFFGSEIITNERLDALNTWRQCVNNINISVEEQRSLWSLQSLFTAGFYPPVRKSTELLKPCTFQAQLFFFFHGRSVLYQLFPSRIKLFSTSHKFRETAKCHSFSQRNAITSVRNVICNNKLAYLSPASLPSTLPADGHALAANRQHHSLPHIHSLSSRIYSVTLLATAQKRPLQTLLTTIMYEASFIIVCLSWQRNEKPLSFILYKRTSDAAKLT